MPDFARVEAETGPIEAASLFLNAIQAGDVETACRVSVPEMAARLRAGLAVEMRERWSDVDETWGWTTSPEPVGVDLDLVMLVEKAEAGEAEATAELMAIPFIMEHDDGAWRVYELEASVE
jgi:hypothetical protein